MMVFNPDHERFHRKDALRMERAERLFRRLDARFRINLMNLKERHEIAIKKMREHLFRVHSPEALGVILSTEKIHPPITSATNEPTLGSLTYRLTNREYELEIAHFGGSRFNVFVIHHQFEGPILTMIAQDCDAKMLSTQAMRAIKTVLEK